MKADLDPGELGLVGGHTFAPGLHGQEDGSEAPRR